MLNPMTSLPHTMNRFTTIVITLPECFKGEAERIAALLEQGRADIVHIRKPGAERKEVERLVREIPEYLYNKVVVHDHFALAVAYKLRGVHLNSRNPEPPEGWTGTVSRSCHSPDEVREWKERCDYVSLSPIFDSISKAGYHSAFTPADIERAAKDGVIDGKVYALGGVTFARLPLVRDMKFGGAMILGDAWRVEK